MGDALAAAVAVFLLLVAIALMGALQLYRARRTRARDAERARGRAIVAELPTGTDLTLFTEDPDRFYYADRAIDKRLIRAARVLINGAPLAAYVSSRFPDAAQTAPTTFDDRPDGIARDRWDVALELGDETIIISCGAIRERVSQELARKIFDAVKAAVEALDARKAPNAERRPPDA